jgi:hypothetical protein
MRVITLLYQFASSSSAEMVAETARMTIIYLLEHLLDLDSEYVFPFRYFILVICLDFPIKIVSLFSSISAMPRIRSFSKSMELRISLD